MRALAERLPDSAAIEGRLIDVPVCYGADYGPDLADVAAFGGCSEDDVVALHCGITYRVYLVGFVPGLPYLAHVDPRLDAAAADDAPDTGAGRIGGHGGGQTDDLPQRHTRRLEHHRPHAAEALRPDRARSRSSSSPGIAFVSTRSIGRSSNGTLRMARDGFKTGMVRLKPDATSGFETASCGQW